MLGLYGTKLALSNAFLQNLIHANKDGLDVGFDDFVDVLRLALLRPHHLALHEARIESIRRDEIEISSGIRHDLFSRREGTVERLEDGVLEPGERTIEDCAVQRFLVLKVVVKKGLVDLRFAGDGVGTGSGDAMLGKLAGGGLENGGAAFFRLAAGSHVALPILTAVLKQSSHIN